MYNFQIRGTGKTMIKHEKKRKKFQLKLQTEGLAKENDFRTLLHLPWLLPPPNQQSWEHQDISVTVSGRFVFYIPYSASIATAPFFSSAVYVPPSTLQYSLSSPHIQCPSTALVTPSHIPASFCNTSSHPSIFSFFPHLLWTKLPPTSAYFYILSVGQEPTRAPVFSCQTVDDDKGCISFSFYFGGILLSSLFRP